MGSHIPHAHLYLENGLKFLDLVSTFQVIQLQECISNNATSKVLLEIVSEI